MKIWHNGILKDENEPILLAAERMRLGDCVFDTALITGGEVQHKDRHFDRLAHNANLLLGTMPLKRSIWNDAIHDLVSTSDNNALLALNTIITSGPGGRGLHAPDDPDWQIILRLSPAPQNIKTIALITAQTTRRNELSPLSRIKSGNYGDNLLALREAQQKGADDAILLNTQGHAACATVGNVFAVLNGALVTPPLEDGAMDGIARALLIERVDVEERSLTLEDLRSAGGVFITNCVRGAVVVSSLDGQDIPAPSLDIPKDFHLDS